jgi:4'-phosphopantetheinyl transferase
MFSRTVDVVTVDLSTVAVDEDLLSVAELGRALGIARTQALGDYLRAHTWLRQRLAEYLDVSAADIEFGVNDQGKPFVESPVTDLAFNLSYAGGMAALAVGFRLDVGVDIEPLKKAKINPDMIHRVLSRPEAESVRHSGDMKREFYKLWVRKEAMAKANGWGVGEEATTNVLGLSPVTRDGFDIIDVNLGEGFAAAVAVPEGCSIELRTLIDVMA